MKTVFILLAMLIVSVSGDTINNNYYSTVSSVWSKNEFSDSTKLFYDNLFEPQNTIFFLGDNMKKALSIGFEGDSLKITAVMQMDSASQVFLEFLKRHLNTPENWCDKKGGKN